MKKNTEKKIAQVLLENLKNASNEKEESYILDSFIKTLKNKSELKHLESITYTLKDLIEEDTGTVKAHVTVQERMTPQVKNNLRSTLKEKYKANDVYITEKVDERILGGFKLKIGEEVYDATIKNKLMRLGQALQMGK